MRFLNSSNIRIQAKILKKENVFARRERSNMDITKSLQLPDQRGDVEIQKPLDKHELYS